MRYHDFIPNARYHEIRKPLEANPKLVKERFLDAVKKTGIKKRYYNPNIVAEFDKHCSKMSELR